MKGTFDFVNKELNIKEIYNNKKKQNDEIVSNLNKEINDYILRKSIDEIFNFFKTRLFITSILK